MTKTNEKIIGNTGNFFALITIEHFEKVVNCFC